MAAAAAGLDTRVQPPVARQRPAGPIFFALFLPLAAFLFTARPVAAETSAASYREKAQSLGLGTAPSWKKLLLYKENWAGQPESLIDDPSYFLADEGKRDSEAELEATLSAFFQTKAPGDGEKPLVCRYPARFAYLDERLNLPQHLAPQKRCRGFASFDENLRYDAVSLVFTGYFLNNPQSMFGHTFLRLHRRRDKGDPLDRKALLDDAANFSAFVEKTDPVTYALKGLAGYFPGRFSLLPYYRKTQEYNNFESRDLWEYELDLTPKQTEFLKLLLWELGNTHLDYYYLDDNCSYVLLALLEAVDPRIDARGRFEYYAIPADTLRAVVEVEGIVRKIRYRPSSLRRYLHHLKELKDGEKPRLRRVIEERDEPLDGILRGCREGCKARVLDAAIEWVDFHEKLAGARRPEDYKTRRGEILKMRAGIDRKPTPPPPKPRGARPDLGHGTTLMGLEGGRSRGADVPFYDLRWRPALHDITIPGPGYPDGMEIRFLDTRVRFRQGRRPMVPHLGILTILSLPKDRFLVPSLAWEFDFRYETYRNEADPVSTHYRRLGLKGGVGKVYGLGADAFLFGLIGADVGGGTDPHQRYDAGLLAHGGVSWSPSSHTKLTLQGEGGRYLGGERVTTRLSAEAVFAYALSERFEWRTTVRRQKRPLSASSGITVHF